MFHAAGDSSDTFPLLRVRLSDAKAISPVAAFSCDLLGIPQRHAAHRSASAVW